MLEIRRTNNVVGTKAQFIRAKTTNTPLFATTTAQYYARFHSLFSTLFESRLGVEQYKKERETL